ncbi:MAG: lysophospholipid acyltransferase family protein [Pseudomonadota bacterium]
MPAGSAITKAPKRVRWHHRPKVRHVLAGLIAGYIRLIDRTGRWNVNVPPATAALIRDGRPFIGAFWHGRLLMIYPAWRRLLIELGQDQRRQPYVISSSHGDGQLIQLAVNRFGLKTLWGSSRRGGAKVLREAKQVLSAGDIIVMTPDGPRGPRMRAQPGIAYLSGSVGVPVVPITFATRRERILGSWDRFKLVWPFASGVLAFGEPLAPTAGSDTESRRRAIEAHMIAFARDIDLAAGLEPIEPGDPIDPGEPVEPRKTGASNAVNELAKPAA